MGQVGEDEIMMGTAYELITSGAEITPETTIAEIAPELRNIQYPQIIAGTVLAWNGPGIYEITGIGGGTYPTRYAIDSEQALSDIINEEARAGRTITIVYVEGY